MFTSRSRSHGRAWRLRHVLPAVACVAVPALAWAIVIQVEDPGRAAQASPRDLEAAVPARHFINVASTADHILEERARNRRRDTEVQVRSGDTMMGLLQRAGVGRSEAYRAIEALKKVYSPRDIRPGQAIHLALLHDETGLETDSTARLAEMRLRASVERDVKVARNGDGFVAESVERSLSRGVAGARGEIRSSLYVASEQRNVPVAVILEMIHGFSFAIDFQRDLRRGDRFEVVYEAFREAGGQLAKTGPLLYASLDQQGNSLEMYRYETSDGEVDYFTPKGESVRRLLMRTPVDGARLSSGYGMRKHPILGYSRMHQGIDFAAPRGTPVYAAGNGKVEYAGRNGGYGNYIRIRHNGSFKTAYAHLKGFAKGVHGGARVRQGEVIGYIGTTGSSTGPHLHYEVLKGGGHVNPRSLDLPTGRTLRGKELARFQQVKADIDRLRDGLPETRIAQASCGDGGAKAKAKVC
ncbi:M23 family metallopeptidase [Ferruginivarius sediminum]|uniref:M23 family peptidase n=1 Tax=Ferruginivarius sediminum TaxID=2661937 RepID=A0A369T940_9PROT|nr:M23 family metallopeptidase [Ferruginivarius sediminum]RDD60994.1 M23 family peptidase [Ferruginivarius sediminum]